MAWTYLSAPGIWWLNITLCILCVSWYSVPPVWSHPFLFYSTLSFLFAVFCKCLKASICPIEIVTGQLKKSENRLALLLWRRNRLISVTYVTIWERTFEAIRLLSYKNVAYTFFSLKYTGEKHGTSEFSKICILVISEKVSSLRQTNHEIKCRLTDKAEIKHGKNITYYYTVSF